MTDATNVRGPRVLHLNYERVWRGGERQTLLTAAEQRRQGTDSHLACRRGSPLEEAARAEGIPTISLPGAAPGALVALMRLAASFDLFHYHSGRIHSLGSLATLFRAKPNVVTRRVPFVPTHSSFNRWKYRRADKVVCVSKWIATVMQQWGLPPERLAVVYDAVPPGEFWSREASLKEIRERTGIAAGQRIVGNIGALDGHKDQATLLKAAASVVARHRDVAFVIVGEGELKQSLLQLRSQLGLEKTLHFTGFIPQAQRLLPGFDVLAVSSSVEGLGSVALDAGLAGIPVASTAGGGLPEVVLDNQTGLLVPIGDAPALAGAILRLLAEPALASRLAAAAQERIRTDFSVPRMARSYLAMYQEILRTGG